MAKVDGGDEGVSTTKKGAEAGRSIIAAKPRTPEQVIDVAITENKKWEWLCFGMALGFGLTALVAIWFGAWYNNEWAAVGGSASSAAFAWVLQKAIGIWRANMTLRMLELSLNEPKEVKATLAALREVYLSHYKMTAKKEGE